LLDVARVMRRRERAVQNEAPRRKRRSSDSAPSRRRDEKVPVIVASSKGQRVGLMVGEIVDIVEDQLAIRSSSGRPGVLFTTVLQDRVTEFLDVDEIIQWADPDSFGQPEETPVGV
jgi:two-component system chemotaxis sensor kinase CheA